MTQAEPRLLSTSEVLRTLHKNLPQSHSPNRNTLIAWARRGIFPSFVEITPQRFAWDASQVVEWLQSRGISAPEM